MCYSKEVQLATGSTILLLGSFYYVVYSTRYHALGTPWLMPFLKYVILGFMMIGCHQVFEFLSLATQHQWVYKIGLLLSISSMYFFLRSLETLLNRSVKSWLALVVIGGIAVHALFVTLPFGAHEFYVRHSAGFIWASAWMLLFIYFHICAIRGRRVLRDDRSKRAILTYLLATMDISFVLSAVYVLWGYWHFGVNVCTDSPSIWCTFYVVQCIALPVFLAALPRLLDSPAEKTRQTLKETIVSMTISLVVLCIMISTLPFFRCLNMKFVFP